MTQAFRYVLPVALLVATPCLAQSNTIAGRDVQLLTLSTLSAMGRSGTFPNGLNGFAMTTTSCNPGTSNIPWEQAMDPDHPFICFLIARNLNGRVEQISDYSYIKHGFFATNSSGCGTCSPAGGSALGKACTDTYSTVNNGDNFWLGPPTELDPWLGIWQPQCSHFDQGEPAVNPPQNCDGLRSLTAGQASALGPVGHRVRILDSDLNVPGATFAYQGMYVIESEAESLRANNMCWRPFTPTWSAGQNKWNVAIGSPTTYNSILSGWSGASLASNTNGVDDGRVFVAVKVTGPTNGQYHYEFAVHNRDNGRGFSSFRLPICAEASFSNAGFHDVDQDAGNQWTATRSATEISWTAPVGNALRWNSFYNFWFDSDAAPVAGSLSTLDQALAGAGASSVTVTTSAPLGAYNVTLGPGCSDDLTPPALYATGAPAQAVLPNASFAIEASGLPVGAPTSLIFGAQPGSIDFGGGCTQWMGGLLGVDVVVLGSQLANGAGVASFAIPIPNDPSLEGQAIRFQAVDFNVGGGPLFANFELSNGLKVRAGNAIPGCE